MNLRCTFSKYGTSDYEKLVFSLSDESEWMWAPPNTQHKHKNIMIDIQCFHRWVHFDGINKPLFVTKTKQTHRCVLSGGCSISMHSFKLPHSVCKLVTYCIIPWNDPDWETNNPQTEKNANSWSFPWLTYSNPSTAFRLILRCPLPKMNKFVLYLISDIIISSSTQTL